MIIETKFSIGDVVWFATTRTEQQQLPCPDCNGAKKWKATSPAGGEYEFNCPRCSSNYGPSHPLTLKYTQFAGETQRLTIGQVNASTSDDGTRYMCHETGIGSGSLYTESRLFHTEAEAQIAADAQAAECNAGAVPWVKKQYDEVLALCEYELRDARSMQAMQEKSSYQWKLHDLLESIDAAETKAEVDELVKEFRE